jgi:hypothetical protein
MKAKSCSECEYFDGRAKQALCRINPPDIGSDPSTPGHWPIIERPAYDVCGQGESKDKPKAVEPKVGKKKDE